MMGHKILWSAIIALVAVVAAFGYVMIIRVIAPPTQFAFVSTRVDPQEVVAGGPLTMTATADVFGSPACYSGAQRIIRFSDLSEARVPGTRRTLGHAVRQTIVYEMTLPDNAPAGQAFLTVRELFSCGDRMPVESPAVRFVIVAN